MPKPFEQRRLGIADTVKTKHSQKRGEKTRRERSGSGGYATLLQASPHRRLTGQTPRPMICSRAARSKSFFLQVRASRFVIDEMKRWSLRRQDRVQLQLQVQKYRNAIGEVCRWHHPCTACGVLACLSSRLQHHVEIGPGVNKAPSSSRSSRSSSMVLDQL